MKKKSNYELDQCGLYPTVFWILKQSEKEIALKNDIPVYSDDYDRLYIKWKDLKAYYEDKENKNTFTSAKNLLPKTLGAEGLTVTKLPAHLNKLN